MEPPPELETSDQVSCHKLRESMGKLKLMLPRKSQNKRTELHHSLVFLTFSVSNLYFFYLTNFVLYIDMGASKNDQNQKAEEKNKKEDSEIKN